MVRSSVCGGTHFPSRFFTTCAARVAAFLCAALSLALPRALAQPVAEKTPEKSAPPASVAEPPTTEPGAAGRRFEEVRGDLDAQGSELARIVPGVESLFDESKRSAVAPKAVPILRKMAALMDEAIGMAPQAVQLRRARMELSAMLSLLGDEPSTLLLRKQAVLTDPEESISARAWGYVLAFAHAGKNADGQKNAVADLARLAQEDPANDMIAQAAYLMTEQAGTPAASAEAEKIITEALKSPMAERMAADLASEHKRRALENKPLVIRGVKVDGTAFSSADWKGKVVLVDFWATWCGPCMHEFPHVKKVYDTYHAKGLEIVGVSCDTDADDLKAFLGANPGLAWPELFDPKAAAAPAFHPLAVEFGVHAIPTAFLIDRKGIVRSIDAGADMDTLVQKLLDEKAE